MGWVVNATPRPIYPRERPGTLCIGRWVGPRASLDGCGKSRLHRDLIPGPSSPSQVIIPTVSYAILRSAHTMYLCVLCRSENKQPLFHYIALTDWFYNRDLTRCSPVVTICTTSLIFNNSTFCPYSVFMCFVMI